MDSQDISLLIVNKKTGKVSEPVMRCLHNFNDYVVVGTILASGDFETYTFIETPNIKEKNLTIARYDEAKAPYESNPLLSYSQEELDKEIMIRAKDLIFNF